MIHLKKAALALAVASTFALAGCSNSSSSGGGEVAPPGGSVQSVAGAAVKGVLKNAAVTIFELSGSGERTEVGASKTNDDGEYEVQLSGNYQGGLLEVEVTSVPGQTRMVCDASACGTVEKGQDFDIPSGFKMTALVEKESGSAKISAPVTAWSTMASNRAKALVSEGLSYSDASRRASSEVSLVAGFDVSRTTARDISDLAGASEKEVQAAAMNAVIAEAVFSVGDGGVLDFVTRFEQLSKVLDDGALDDNDGELRTALADATVKVSQDSTIQLAESVRKELDSVANQVKEGIDVSNSTDSELSFRGFVSQVRAWANSIESVNSEELSAAVKADSETIKNIFSASTEGQFAFLGHVLDAANEFLLNSPEQVSVLINNGGSKSVTVEDDNGRTVGAATLKFSDNNGLSIEITGQAGTGEVFEPVNLVMATSIPVSQLDVVAQPDREGSINLLINSLQKENSIALSGTIGSDLIALNNLSLNLSLQESITASAAGGMMDEADSIEAKFASAKLAGQVTINSAEGDRFSGDLEVGLTRLKDADLPYSALNFTRISVERFRVSGEFDSANPEVGSFSASAALNIRNGAEFDVLSWGEYSSQTRWLPLSATEEELGFMSQPFSDDVVVGFVQGGFDADYQGQWGYGQYFVDNGQARENYLYPGDSNLSGMTDQVVNSVLQRLRGLEGRFVLESWETNSAIYELTPEEFTTLPLVYGWINYDEVVGYGNVTLGMDGGSLGSFEDSSLVFVDANGGRISVGNVWSDEEGGSTLSFDASFNVLEDWVSGGAQLIGTPNPLLEVDASQYVNVEGATYRGYWLDFSSMSGEVEYWGNVNYQVPVSLSRFEACVSNAPNELQKLTGWAYSDLSEQETLVHCAENTLAGNWADFGYSDYEGMSVDFSQLDQVGRNILVSELGDFAEDVDTRSYYSELTFGSAASGLSNAATIEMLAEFPDLETADYFLNGSITVSAEVELPELPLAKATVTLDRTAQKGGSVLANVIWNGGNYSVRVASTNFEDLAGTEVNAEFFNAEGHLLQLTPSFDADKKLVGLTGKAMANGQEVGKVTLRDTAAGKIPVIEYNSGSETIVETLF